MAIKLDLQPNWKILCDSLQDEIMECNQTCPEIVEQVEAAVKKFSAQPVPTTIHEMQLRFAQVGAMRGSWENSFVRKATLKR